MPAVRTLGELPLWAEELLGEARVAHLGVSDDELVPRVLPVTFAITQGAVWSAIDDKPKRVTGGDVARVRWLRARPESAITVDRYDDDWTRLAWVQIVGSTTITDTAGHDDAIAALAARYPQYRELSPRGPLLRLMPARVVYWRAAGNA
jgi:PPOX class probable F420-dependent enzyme